MKKISLILTLIGSILTISAQQDPQYTQYMYNQNVINPAYVTNELGIVNFGFMHRTQWTNAVGAPKTYTFFAHTPITKKFEIGLSLITDNIGDGALKENNVYADFAYILQFNEDHKLSLGLKAGVTSLATNFTNFRFPDDDIITGFTTNDIAFDNQNTTVPNFGIGAFYFTDNYYVGISAPNLLNSKHLEDKNGLKSIGGEEIHFFMNAGYVFKLSDVVKLKPSMLLKAVKGSPLVLDTSINVLFNERFEGGLSYRINDSASAMFNVRATDFLRIGYAFDYTTSNLSNFNSGTHEVFVLFDFDLLGLKKGYDKSPRFF
ncbi:Type IX secretion system membrane protein, PorP/SprF family [Tenacibaculum sp. 190524A02b]|uniref:Type IX secretion system membrane protein PorP/SprF n=1 Tax=Tenacibaculum vairaonense TaxID=3137860 RepID=A0ABP1F784_9FLAO